MTGFINRIRCYTEWMNFMQKDEPHPCDKRQEIKDHCCHSWTKLLGNDLMQIMTVMRMANKRGNNLFNASELLTPYLNKASIGWPNYCCAIDNYATNYSFYVHWFDASRWSRATFCFDFMLMVILRLGSSIALLLQHRRANYKKPAVQPSRFILGVKRKICGIDIPKETHMHDCTPTFYVRYPLNKIGKGFYSLDMNFDSTSMISRCTYAGQEHRMPISTSENAHHCNLFKPFVTDMGICHSFNAQPLETLLKPSHFLGDYSNVPWYRTSQFDLVALILKQIP